MSRMTSNWPPLSGVKGNHLEALASRRARISGDGLGSQSWGCLVPPMTVPPSSGRGMQKDQDPSWFWRVIVAETGLRTRQVWPWWKVSNEVLYRNCSGLAEKPTSNNEGLGVIEPSPRAVDHRLDIIGESKGLFDIHESILLRPAPI